MTIQELANKSILIVGYGREGKATEAFIKHHVPSATIGIADQADGSDYLKKQHEYDLAVRSPGVRPSLITIPCTTATNIFFANVKRPIIGVTGTKGKSTTSSLITAMLKQGGLNAILAGNIGIPMLSFLMEPISDDAIFVCELSSYQLEDIRYSPHISVVVSLFPEHMDHHGSVESYYKAKKSIIAHVTPEDYFVYNQDVPFLREWAETVSCNTVPFDTDIPVEAVEAPIPGKHNMDNIRAAATVARLLGVSREAVREAVLHFKSLPHRLERIGTYRDITFYDDAISTTPESTIRAIQTVERVGTIFLGGLDRGYDFEELVQTLSKYNVPCIVLFPESGTKIRKVLENMPEYKPTILETDSMEKAVLFAYRSTPSGSACLLSSASPSYSLWKNFEQKGNEFRAYVEKYADK